MATAVDIYLADDSLSPSPIQSAVVAVYDLSTMTEQAQAVSDSNGRASFLLNGTAGPGTGYEVRVYKQGVVFPNPVRISVIEPVVTTNKFDIAGTLLTLPISIDPRVCRCTGRFMGFTNQPLTDISFRISALNTSGSQTPKVVDGSLISPDTTVYHSDDDGIVTVDLLRGGQYYITFSGEEDVVWPIYVPDRASVNLIDLIHPAPVSMTWDQTDAPGNAITVQIGQFKEVKYSVTLSDYRVVSSGNNLQNVINIWNSDNTIMDVAAGDATTVTLGKAAGSAQVTATLSPTLTPIRVPLPTLLLTPLSVTVTP